MKRNYYGGCWLFFFSICDRLYRGQKAERASLGVGENFRLLVQSYFFLRPLNDNVKFLEKLSIRFFLHRQSTPKGAPACAMASKSYDWNLRKISPKMGQKQPILNFCRFSRELSQRFERNFSLSFYAILVSYVYNDIKIV